MTENFCADQGTLAQVRRPIPTDPQTFAYRGISRVLPCSHVACGSCGTTVRWLDGQSIPRDRLATAYDAAKPSEFAGPMDADWRFYFCRCDSFICQTSVALSLADDIDLRLGLPEGWACAGHPPRTLPTTIQGVELPKNADWRAIVSRSFRAVPPEGNPHFWARWLPEVYGQLTGTPHPEVINGVIADLMTSSDACLRTGALYFLWDSLALPAVDLLPVIFLEDADSLRSQRDTRGDTDLYHLTACAIAFHIKRDRWPYEGALRDALRTHILEPNAANGVGWLLARRDPAWFLDQYEALLEASPGAREKLERWRTEAAEVQAMFGS